MAIETSYTEARANLARLWHGVVEDRALFREDPRYWVETDRRVALRALDLVEAIM
jgi:hypothetical protein